MALPVTQFDGRLSISLYVDANGRQPAYRAYEKEFFVAVLSRPDQLRQRVAFALAQIAVVSQVEVDGTYGHRAYHNMLLGNAFGRVILTFNK